MVFNLFSHTAQSINTCNSSSNFQFCINYWWFFNNIRLRWLCVVQAVSNGKQIRQRLIWQRWQAANERAHQVRFTLQWFVWSLTCPTTTTITTITTVTEPTRNRIGKSMANGRVEQGMTGQERAEQGRAVTGQDSRLSTHAWRPIHPSIRV